MKQLRLFTVFVAVSFMALHAWAQDSGATTWLVVRHVDRAGEDDAITPAGEERAEQLAQLAKVLRVEVIYSTDFQRTRRTADPAARELNLEINTYSELNDDLFKDLKSRHAGQVVLIVGHSNTVGRIVNGLGVTGDFPIADDEFDSLFVVRTHGPDSAAFRLHYGAAPLTADD